MAVPIFFIAYLCLGFAIVGNYGISGDEPTERETSLRQYRFAVSKVYYAFKKEKVPGIPYDYVWYQNFLQGTNNDKYYGTFLQWPSVVLEHLSGFTLHPTQIYYSRHVLNFLYFFGALICFYLLLKDRFKKRSIALLSVLVVILSPRFFAESFYNNKDILFAATYIVAIFFSQRMLQKTTWSRTGLAALFVALAMNTRIVAVLIPAVYLGAVIVRLVQTHKWSMVYKLGFFLAATLGIYLAIHPTAWGNELHFIPQALTLFSDYGWNHGTLYWGEPYYNGQWPWHFPLGYLWVTTPLAYTLGIVVGCVVFLSTFIHSVLTKKNEWPKLAADQDFLMFILALAPVVAVILLHSTLYHGWRHLYFIYFPFVYFLAYGLDYWNKNAVVKKVLYGIVIAGFISSGSWMLRHHPHQFMYYNPLVRHSVANNFERDYWYLSKKDLFALLMNIVGEEGPKIKLFRSDPLAIYSWVSMSDLEANTRFEYVDDINHADFASEVFYGFKGDDIDGYLLSKGFEQFEVIETIQIDGIPVAVLMRRR